MFDPSTISPISVYDMGGLTFPGAPSLVYKIGELLSSGGFSFPNLEAEARIRVLDSMLPRCRLCHLSATHVPIPPRVAQNQKLLVVGRNPNKGDASTRKLFDSPTQVCRLFRKYLDILQASYQETSILNCCNCYLNGSVAPQPSEIFRCREWLYLYLSAISIPSTVLLLGNDAIRAFLGDNFPAITSCIGSLIQASVRGVKTLIVPIYHPGQVLRQPELWQDVKAVLSEAQKLRSLCC